MIYNPGTGGITCDMFFWGVLGLAWVKLMLPWLLRLIQRIPWKIRYSLTATARAEFLQ